MPLPLLPVMMVSHGDGDGDDVAVMLLCYSHALMSVMPPHYCHRHYTCRQCAPRTPSMLIRSQWCTPGALSEMPFVAPGTSSWSCIRRHRAPQWCIWGGATLGVAPMFWLWLVCLLLLILLVAFVCACLPICLFLLAHRLCLCLLTLCSRRHAHRHHHHRHRHHHRR